MLTLLNTVGMNESIRGFVCCIGTHLHIYILRSGREFYLFIHTPGRVYCATGSRDRILYCLREGRVNDKIASAFNKLVFSCSSGFST